jgi:hypothetical protein
MLCKHCPAWGGNKLDVETVTRLQALIAQQAYREGCVAGCWKRESSSSKSSWQQLGVSATLEADTLFGARQKGSGCA